MIRNTFTIRLKEKRDKDPNQPLFYTLEDMKPNTEELLLNKVKSQVIIYIRIKGV